MLNSVYCSLVDPMGRTAVFQNESQALSDADP